MATVAFLVGGIVLLSLLTSRLLELLALQRAGAGSFVNSTRRLIVLVTGDTVGGQLNDVLSELFHPDHTGVRQYVHAVVLLEGDSYSTNDKRFFARHPVFQNVVTYLKGSVFSFTDLVRASAVSPELQAVLILQHRDARDDTQNLLRVLAVRRHLPLTPVYVMLARNSSRHHLMAAGVPDEFILPLDVYKSGALQHSSC